MSQVSIPVTVEIDGVSVPTTLTLDSSALPPRSALKSSRFFAHRNGVAQPGVADAVYTNLLMTTTRFNTGGLFDVVRSCAKMPGPGVFLTGGEAWDWGATVGGNTFVAKVIKNGVPLGGDDGADVSAVIADTPTLPGYPAMKFAALDECALNDLYEVIVYVQGGGSLDGNPAHTYWWGIFFPDPS